jgi:hypothetical protein
LADWQSALDWEQQHFLDEKDVFQNYLLRDLRAMMSWGAFWWKHLMPESLNHGFRSGLLQCGV